MELRCTSKKHGELITPTDDEGVVEVRCDSRWCGAGNGVIVLHRFSTKDARCMETKRYQRAPKGG